jgi:hypothetical protein
MAAIKTALAILGILGAYALVGTIEYDGNQKPMSITVPTLERWCESNPQVCDDVGHKRLFVQAAD